MESKNHPIGNTKNNSLNGRARKDQRRQEAYERQDAYNALSLKEKLAKLPPEPGAKKQRARLLALLSKKSETQKSEVPNPEFLEKQKEKAKARKQKVNA